MTDSLPFCAPLHSFAISVPGRFVFHTLRFGHKLSRPFIDHASSRRDARMPPVPTDVLHGCRPIGLRDGLLAKRADASERFRGPRCFMCFQRVTHHHRAHQSVPKSRGPHR